MTTGSRTIVVAAAALLAPAIAAAGPFSFALSVGSGYRASPDAGRIPTTVMLAPGLPLLDDLVRLELGLAADLPDVDGSRLDLQIRPMAVLRVPMLRVYGRIVAAAADVVHGPVAAALGLAVGYRRRLGGPVAAFAEAGYLPRVTSGRFENVVEGRLGVVFGD